MTDLDERLRAAHAAHDKPALVALYQDAAAQVADDDRRAFFLTQAYVFALDCGLMAEARGLRASLVALKRENADAPDV